MEREDPEAKGGGSLQEEEVVNRVTQGRSDRSHLDVEVYAGSTRDGGHW